METLGCLEKVSQQCGQQAGKTLHSAVRDSNSVKLPALLLWKQKKMGYANVTRQPCS
jgi:hypothetical protein